MNAANVLRRENTPYLHDNAHMHHSRFSGSLALDDRDNFHSCEGLLADHGNAGRDTELLYMPQTRRCKDRLRKVGLALFLVGGVVTLVAGTVAGGGRLLPALVSHNTVVRAYDSDNFPVVEESSTEELAAESDEDSPPLSPKLCDSAAALPGLSLPIRSFDLPDYWSEACEKLVPFINTTWARKEHNRCWDYVKQQAADNWGTSWWAAQELAAKNMTAPFPELVPMHPLRNRDLCEQSNLGGKWDTNREAEVDSAWEWFNTVAEVYVINLLTETWRWQSMHDHLSTLGVRGFKRSLGLDLAQWDSYGAAKQNGLIPWDFNVTRALELASSGIGGSMGRTAAHLGTMRNASKEESARQLVLVLEDDVRLPRDFAIKLRAIVEGEVPCDWVAISLQSVCPFGECVSKHLTRVRPDGNVPAAFCHRGVNYGFHALLYRRITLSNLTARLEKVAWNSERPDCLDVDVALASISDNVAYYAVPSVQQPGLINATDRDSKLKTKNHDSTLQSRLVREQREIESKLDLAEANLAHEYWKTTPGGAKEREDLRVFYRTTTATTSTATTTSFTTSTSTISSTTSSTPQSTETSTTSATTTATSITETATTITATTITTQTTTNTPPPPTTVTNFLSGELTYTNR